MKPLFIKSISMIFLVAAFVLAGCGDNAFDSGSDESSTEACKYAVSQALDEGRYDDVLASSCAHAMDLAAAYMGKAGYDVNDVVESMINANNASGDSIDVYMNDLVGTVSNVSLENLYKAREAYDLIPATDSHYDAARFNNVVLVNSLIAISNIKGVMGGTTIPDTSTCDRNSNGTPDKADAAGCAFYIAAAIGNCTAQDASYSAPFANVQFADLAATYTGYIITIDDKGGPKSDPDCQETEKKLLSSGMVAATTSDTCTDLGGNTWPCPFEDEDEPVDVVSVFEEILESSSDLLETMFGSDTTEVSEAVDDLLSDACGADGTCTSQEIADYLQGLN